MIQFYTITATGDNVFAFLQRIVTQDLHTCKETPKLSALCQSFGKVTHLFWLQTDPIQLITTEPEKLIQSLQFYDPFSEITFQTEPRSDLSFLSFKKDRPLELQLIQSLLPLIDDAHRNKYTPQILRLDEHGAISLSKGCFIGHEPIARTQLKGRTKRKTYYQTNSEAPTNAISCFFDGTQYHYLVIQTIA